MNTLCSAGRSVGRRGRRGRYEARGVEWGEARGAEMGCRWVWSGLRGGEKALQALPRECKVKGWDMDRWTQPKMVQEQVLQGLKEGGERLTTERGRRRCGSRCCGGQGGRMSGGQAGAGARENA